ncbi:hypothetical protein BJX64DRAFT_248763 [Aspergillus heterothallicus]
MRLANLLLSASLASGQALRLLPGFQTTGGLVPRQLVGDGSDCSIYDTCGECFGTGYVLCDNAGCFNPDDGEQCCEGGSMCVGLDSSCCIDGPGTPGEDGAIDYDSLDDDEEDEDSSTSWQCDITMTEEECCVAGGENIHWCPGDLSGGLCMNSTEMVCCEDGHICDTDGCCELVDSTPVTPWETSSSSSQSTPEPSSSGISNSNSNSNSNSETNLESDTDSDPDSGSESSTSTAPSATSPSTSPSVDSSSPTPTDAGIKLGAVQGASALAGVLVAVILVL